MKKIVLTVLALMLVMVSVCACSEGTDESSQTESSKTEAVSSEADNKDESSEPEVSVETIVAAKTSVSLTYLYEEPSEETDYITFVDKTYTGILDEDILFSTSATITDFKFFAIEYDENDNYVIGETLYALTELVPENNIHINTYLNDVVTNRGVSFVEEGGEAKNYAIVRDWNEDKLVLVEIGA